MVQVFVLSEHFCASNPTLEAAAHAIKGQLRLLGPHISALSAEITSCRDALGELSKLLEGIEQILLHLVDADCHSELAADLKQLQALIDVLVAQLACHTDMVELAQDHVDLLLSNGAASQPKPASP